MAIDRRHVGLRYGPYRYAVGEEKIADFAVAVAGGTPGRVFGAASRALAHPFHLEGEAARTSPHGSIIAPPMFAVAFAMQPFSDACADPELGLDLLRLVHGEQEFVWHGVIRPGDVMETTGEIAEAYSKGPLDFLVVRTTSTDQRGKVVVEGIWTAVIRNA